MLYVQVKLRAAITAVVPLPNSDWEDLEKAVVIMKPLAWATNICQRDDANVSTLFTELRKLPPHFQKLEIDDPSLKEFCKQAQVCIPRHPSVHPLLIFIEKV